MSPHVSPRGAVHVCLQCPKKKTFSRACDLNKHAKSHTRPYKCTVPTCKYVLLGWPTSKELERHINDKHSASPRNFPCHFEPCTYSSKRESNCKQHMEKNHNWVYVRSRPGGKRSASHTETAPPATPASASAGDDDHDGAAGNGSNHAPSPLMNWSAQLGAEHDSPATSLDAQADGLHRPPGADFLFPGNDYNIVLGDDGDHEVDGGFLPWNKSPGSRRRGIESVIERFDEEYEGLRESLGLAEQTHDPSGVGLGLMSPTFSAPSVIVYQQAVSSGQFAAGLVSPTFFPPGVGYQQAPVTLKSPAMTTDTAFPIPRPRLRLQPCPATTAPAQQQATPAASIAGSLGRAAPLTATPRRRSCPSDGYSDCGENGRAKRHRPDAASSVVEVGVAQQHRQLVHVPQDEVLVAVQPHLGPGRAVPTLPTQLSQGVLVPEDDFGDGFLDAYFNRAGYPGPFGA
jgi:hypothetical protein